MREAVVGEDVALDDYDYEWTLRGRASVETIFEYAHLANIGEYYPDLETQDLAEALGGGPEYVFIDLETGTYQTIDRTHPCIREHSRYGGFAIVPIKDAEWIFWRPVNHEIDEPRLLVLPKWIQGSGLSYQIKTT